MSSIAIPAAIQFLGNCDGPDYVYWPGGPSWNAIWGTGPNAIPQWESTAWAAGTINGIFGAWPIPLGAVVGQSAADIAYATALNVYYNTLQAIANTYDSAGYAPLLSTWSAALSTWVAAGQPYSGTAFNTFNTASGTFLTAMSAIADAYDAAGVNAAEAALTAAYNVWLAAYNVYIAWATGNTTLAKAIAFHQANPTEANPYSSINF